MNKLVGSADAQSVNEFVINGQSANGIALDFSNNEIVAMNGDVEVARIGIAALSYDLSATVLAGDMETNVKVKLPR